MGTTRVVQAGLVQTKPLHRSASHDVLLNDFLDIVHPHKTVPDGIGIDDERGAVFALVQTAGLVRPHPPRQATFGQCGLERGPQIAGATFGTAATRVSGRSTITANKDMAFILWHVDLVAPAKRPGKSACRQRVGAAAVTTRFRL